MRIKRGLAGLASVGAVLAVGALAPSAAMAHPCMADIEASIGKNMSLHTGGSWAGYMPSFQDLEHECANIDSEIYQSIADSSIAADPVPGVPAGPIVSAAGYAIKNLTALGYSARNVPYTGTGSGVYNSDLAFKDNYVFSRHLRGLPRHRRHEQVRSDAAPELHGLQRRPGRRDRLREHPDPLLGPARERELDVRRPARRFRLRGHPHLRHHRPDQSGDEEAAPDGGHG